MRNVSRLRISAQDTTPSKVDLVDSQGEVIGTRQVADASLLKESLGPQVRVEEGSSAESGKMSLRVRDSEQTISPPDVESWPGAEVRTLTQQGPSANRIDLTIVGDGYTAADKAKFFADAEKIRADLFDAETFHSYLPLFNVHAVFVPSNEEGIGDGRPKDTALGLYRDSRMRQAIMPGKASAARKAAQLAPDTDYPILLANDRLYGGLGGEFAITSASPLNITTVLRHELGHNFGNVGEEYDGGQVYSGANFSRSKDVPWKHFVEGNQVPVHTAKLLHQSAPWDNLSDKSWKTTFQLADGPHDVLLDFSSTGFDTSKDVQLLIDGKPTPFDGEFSYDRNFYRVRVTLPAGQHTVEFKEAVADKNNVLSKINVYSIPADYPSREDLVGAYGTYDESGRLVGYRATDRECLMRNMASRCFCAACTENMWHRFLREVSLIDSVVQNGKAVKANVVPLGAARLKLEWMDPRGKIRPELTNLSEWIPTAADAGEWKLKVSFLSDEVKAPKHTDWSVHTAAFKVMTA
jgi:hypothetical protein